MRLDAWEEWEVRREGNRVDIKGKGQWGEADCERRRVVALRWRKDGPSLVGPFTHMMGAAVVQMFVTPRPTFIC